MQSDDALSTVEETSPLMARTLPRRSDAFFALIGLIMVNGWVAGGAYQVHYSPKIPAVILSYPFILGISWIYPFVRPLARPIRTVPFDILVLNLLHIICSIAEVAPALERKIFDKAPFVWWPIFALQLCQLGTTAVSLLFILTYPLNDVSPLRTTGSSRADAMTLWGFLTYSWIYSSPVNVCQASPINTAVSQTLEF